MRQALGRRPRVVASAKASRYCSRLEQGAEERHPRLQPTLAIPARRSTADPVESARWWTGRFRSPSTSRNS